VVSLGVALSKLTLEIGDVLLQIVLALVSK
jgi:hypothetical protein